MAYISYYYNKISLENVLTWQLGVLQLALLLAMAQFTANIPAYAQKSALDMTILKQKENKTGDIFLIYTEIWKGYNS